MRVPRRIVWAEFYLHDAQGNYVGDAGWSDGNVGVQIYSSSFRLHFGHFAGVPMQVAYLLLGAALCIVIATSVNIWLLRRAQAGRPAVLAQRLWTTMIWGTPLAMSISAFADVVANLNGALVFWLGLLVLLIAGWRISDVPRWSRTLRWSLAAVGVGIVVAHVVRFGGDAFHEASLLVNVSWLALAAGALIAAVTSSTKPAPAALSQPAPVRESPFT
jgi:uncharacterized iron-regulated membrane protein